MFNFIASRERAEKIGALALLVVSLFTSALLINIDPARAASIGTYDQCANDDGDGYTGSDVGCHWVNGNLNGNNSTYQEGDSTVQRVWLNGDTPGSQHTVTFKYGTTKQGKHAYDFLTTWNHSENWITEADRCQDIDGCDTAAESSYPIPADTNGSGLFEFPGRNFVIRGGTINSVTSPVLSGSYAGDSETTITITYTLAESGSMCSTKGTTTTCGAAIWFGAHIANTSEWQPHDGTTGATSISGSPYHVALSALDGGSVGNRDNQMSASVLPTQASLTLLKTVINDNGGTALDTAWTLTAVGPTPISGVEGNAGVTNAQVDAGDYILSESGGPAGYTATLYSCIKNNAAPVISNSITLAADDVAVCTITNDDNAPVLNLNKVVVNDNGGTALESAWTLTATGPTSISGPGAAGSPDVVSGDSFDAGIYVLSESTGPDGYAASAWSCSNGDNDGTISIGLGETVTCTITNNDNQSYIIVDKTVINDNGGTATANDFLLTVDGNAVSDGVAYAVNPGVHTAGETNLPGYTAGVWGTDCSNVGSVTVALGETKTCTITNNDQQAYITVVKVVTNDNGGSAAPNDFLLTLEGNATTSGTPVAVNPGTYTAAETLLPGYTFSGFSGDCNASGDTTVALGESKTCTLTNDDQQSYITVVKVVTNDNGGTAQPADFALTLEGSAVTSGVAVPVNPGTYTAGETLVASYSFEGYSGDCDSNGDTTVALGESKTCTLTNNDDAPVLHLRKVVINDNGGTAEVEDFTLTANGTDSNDISGTDPVDSDGTLIADTFALSETNVDGYTASAWVCVGGTQNGASITLGLGEEATCTITNDDQPGKIILVKNTLGGNGTFDFGVTGPSASTPEIITVGNTGTTGEIVVDAGAYSVTEDAVEGWDLTDATCTSGTPEQFNVVNGGSVTCTFTNTKRGSLEITKALDLGDYDLPVNDSFDVVVVGPSYPNDGITLTFTVTNGIVSDPQTLNNILPGVYSITETDPGIAWAVFGNGNVTVDPGEAEEKTITNTLKQPHTTISIVPSVWETEPGQNVVLAITDSNDGAVPLTNPSVVLTYGVTEITLDKLNYYVSGDANDDGIMDVGEAWVWSYAVLIENTTTFSVAGHGFDPLGNDISPENGYASEADSVEVKTIGTTRTIGFWQTHTNFTSYVFNLTSMQQYIGSAPHIGPITNTLATGQSQLFGGFYAPIAKKTTGAKRTPIDQARIQMLQQLLAAKLNCAAFGCSGATLALIADADAAYAAGSNKNLILSLASQLDTFNNSGDNNAIPVGLPATGKATPKASQSYANTVFWNVP